MKLLITEEQCQFLIREYSNIHDYWQFERNNMSEIFQSIKNGEKVTFSGKINPTQYQNALRDFMRFPRNPHFVRFPVKYVYRWKRIMLENTATLDNLTSIHGHTSYFPYETFYDIFDYSEVRQTQQLNLFTGELEYETIDGEYTTWAKQRYQETGDKEYLQENNFTTIYEYLDDVCHIDDYVPFFSNGQPVLSDFGLRPLTDLAEKLISQERPEEIIITINKMLDITHPRSDLAELFIVGGSDSLDTIAGFEKQEEEYT
jgi:hypothetical protein